MAEQNVERRLMAADEEEHSSERGRSQRSAMERVPIAQSARSEIVRQGAERLASLLTLSDQPMLAWRLDGYVEFWNSGAERLYGFAPDEAVGGSSHTLLQTTFRSLSPNCVLSF
jgi:PAS domain-containing protein